LVLSSFIEVLRTVTVACTAIFIGFYLCYFAVCAFALKAKKAAREVDLQGRMTKDTPRVTMIVPVYNEAAVISRKLDNLRAIDYPDGKLEAIFVDGGSTDGTADLIRSDCGRGHFVVKVVRQGARKGFNSAVIEGFQEAEGEIICIPGAETEYDPQALNLMVRHFDDPSVGAVVGRQRISNLGQGVSPLIEASYRDLYNFLIEAESLVDSPFDVKGEICATRRNILAHLVRNPEFSRRGTIDTCVSFQGRIDGYRAVYEPEAFYYELSPKSLWESFKQGIRRGATLIQNMMIFKTMILNRRYGAFGMLIMPAHFCLLVILPFTFFVGVVGMIGMVLAGSIWAMILVGSGLLAVLLSRRIQALVKTQLVLVVANLRLLTGIETQKFERLHSARP
jgi:cellulose synthase/poly-beta-1,6-N-acetylglucosamine synthase-like glycosyltransferase